MLFVLGSFARTIVDTALFATVKEVTAVNPVAATDSAANHEKQAPRSNSMPKSIRPDTRRAIILKPRKEVKTKDPLCCPFDFH